MMPPSYTDAVPAASLLEGGSGGLRSNRGGFVSGLIEGTGPGRSFGGKGTLYVVVEGADAV